MSIILIVLGWWLGGGGNLRQIIREVIKKKRIFYGQADRKGVGGQPPPGLTVAFVKNLTLFSCGI